MSEEARTLKLKDLPAYDQNRPTVTIIICSRNEAQNIPHVLERARHYGDEILVIDGHSTDETREIAKSYGARVVLDRGKGKGDGIRLGIQEALGEVIVFVDADCSHNPHDIPALVAPLFADTADHVTGSRILGGSEELHGDFGKFIRRFGSDIITMGINLRYQVGLTDSQNGFRALKTSVARQLDLREDITTIEQEMIIKTLALGARMAEVPTREFARLHGDSTIDVTQVSVRYVWTWLKYLATHPKRKGYPKTPYAQYSNPNPWWDHKPEEVRTTESDSIKMVRQSNKLGDAA